MQVTAKMPLDPVMRWEGSFGAGKAGRESGYADYDEVLFLLSLLVQKYKY